MAANKSLTTAEAAEQLGITDRHVRALIAAGTLKAERVGSRLLLVSPASVRRFSRHPTKGRPSKADPVKSDK